MTFALWDMVTAYRDSQPAIVPRRPVIRPIPVDESGFTVEPDGHGGFVVRGTRPERWINQTDFDNDEAVGYLGDRLARLGVEDELLRLGAKPGCAVTIGDMTFDWEPQTPAGVDVHVVRPRHRHPAGADGPGRCRPSARPPAARRGARPGGTAVGRDEPAPRGGSHRAQCRGEGRHHRADHAVAACSTRAGWPFWPTRSKAG